MDWDDLRFFVALARNRKLNAAAAHLRVDATTVGRRVERLSRELNATLLESGPSGYTLTSAGETLLRHAEEVERSVLSASGALTGERSRLSGAVRISLSEGFATWVVAPQLPSFRVAHPDIRLEIVTTNGFLNPSKREADLAVMLARPNRGPLVSRKLAGYGLGLYASTDYVAQHGQVDGIAQLNGRPLIGYIPDFIYSDELRYLEEVEPDAVPVLSSSSINVQIAMVRAGLGLSVLPHFVGLQAQGLVRQCADTVEIQRDFWLVVHRDFRRLARVEAVIGWLADVCARSPYLLPP